MASPDSTPKVVISLDSPVHDSYVSDGQSFCSAARMEPEKEYDSDLENEKTGLLANTFNTPHHRPGHFYGLQNNDDDESDGESVITLLQEKSRNKILIVSLFIVFVRYGIATFISPFFPTYCDDHDISTMFQGFIFSAYPSGMAIMGIFGAKLILKIGTRTSVITGMVFTALTTSLFGLIPDIADALGVGPDVYKYWFLIVYFLSGFIGSLADTGVIIICGEKFKDKSGVVMSAIGTCSGIGCMAGPPLGGVLDSLVGFQLNFIIWGAMCGLVVPLVWLFIPQAFISSDEEKAPLLSVISVSVMISLVAIALSGTIVGSLDPTLSTRLDYMSSALVGVFFMFSSISYTLVGLPVGWLTETFKTRERVGDSRKYKLLQAAGLYVLGAAFILLGPLDMQAFGFRSKFLENTPVAALAMVIKGVGSAGNNAGYPDLVLDIGDNASRQATIDGMWNAAYALGWALGPILGTGLKAALSFKAMATILGYLSIGYAILLTVSSFTRWGSGGYRARKPETQEAREAAVIAAMLCIVENSLDKVDQPDLSYIETPSVALANATELQFAE
eukprot:TRINITY_DN3205_c0_g3_i1.p1 TRINITY_DN3205_c0_g3~~TRINITY_DN3205_c0_g3_i1.p1  ORF type:complete len:576 (+),score=67.35 TRINITY_DN3205_c0_g3_i1:48-1730(+)